MPVFNAAFTVTKRNGICEKCHVPLVKTGDGKLGCPQCRGSIGELIWRQANIEPPKAPTCFTPACLWAYFKSALRYTLVANYHARRMAYAIANRYKEIPERYRTGEPAPQTILGALFANAKLTCPMCRKF